MSRHCRIGLALGGGGARGLAHLGVLSVLEHEGVNVELLTGTSMGALVAGVYALSPSCDSAVERFRRYLGSEEFKKTNLEFLHFHNREEVPRYEGIFQRFASFIKKGIFYSQSLTKRAPISEESFSQNINFLLDDVEIQQTRIPLAIIALDLKSAKEVIMREGSLRTAVQASDRVPVRPARGMGADLVIAVDVAEILDEIEEYNTGLGIVMRTNDISRYTLSRMQLGEADVVISPDVSGIHWSDFGHLEECLRAGEEATRAKLDEIKRMVKRKRLRKIFRFPFARPSSPPLVQG
jgi:NTE family protein